MHPKAPGFHIKGDKLGRPDLCVLLRTDSLAHRITEATANQTHTHSKTERTNTMHLEGETHTHSKEAILTPNKAVGSQRMGKANSMAEELPMGHTVGSNRSLPF